MSLNPNTINLLSVAVLGGYFTTSFSSDFRKTLAHGEIIRLNMVSCGYSLEGPWCVMVFEYSMYGSPVLHADLSVVGAG